MPLKLKHREVKNLQPAAELRAAAVRFELNLTTEPLLCIKFLIFSHSLCYWLLTVFNVSAFVCPCMCNPEASHGYHSQDAFHFLRDMVSH